MGKSGFGERPLLVCVLSCDGGTAWCRAEGAVVPCGGPAVRLSGLESSLHHSEDRAAPHDGGVWPVSALKTAAVTSAGRHEAVNERDGSCTGCCPERARQRCVITRVNDRHHGCGRVAAMVCCQTGQVAGREAGLAGALDGALDG